MSTDRIEALLKNTAACELCGSTEELAALEVSEGSPDDDARILGCAVCTAQVLGSADLQPQHWHCLREAIWSEVPAVQVVSWRLLDRLREQGWAADLLEQAYLAEELLAWAKRTPQADDAADPATKDSNGTELADGDAVTLIKALPVKGANFTAKRGTVVKNIRLTDDPGLVEGKVNNVAIFLKTEFLRKV